MSIDENDPRLTAYVFGELSDADKLALQAELAGDEAARARLAEIQHTVGALRDELFSDPKSRVLEAERRQEIAQVVGQARNKRRRRKLWGAVSLGSMAALVLLLSTTFVAERKSVHPADAPPFAPSEEVTPSPTAVEDRPAIKRLEAYETPETTVELTPPAPAAAPEPARAVSGIVGLKGMSSSPAAAPPKQPASLRARPLNPMRTNPSYGGGDMLPEPKPLRSRSFGDDEPPRAAPQRKPSASAASNVSAGEWDDNANYREFKRWLATEPARAAHRIDIRDRRFLVVRDAAGLGVPACRVLIEDESDRQTELWTTATGRAILFPHAEGLSGRMLTASTDCAGGARRQFLLSGSDGVVDLRTPERRVLPAEQVIDVAFILDSTGSMSEEIAAVKATIQKVASGLRESNVRIRIGLVEFKDRGDPFVTRAYPMSTDLARFSAQVAAVQADGGGDTPESGNEALHVGIQQLAWSDTSLAKLAFLVGDAPPHLDYHQDYDYAIEARAAAHRGIQIYTVAASGMDTLGQVVWRQVAQYTGATNLFVLRGGAGPQSVGAGDPKSSCGGTQAAYTSGNLDALILAKIKGAIRSLERDPMRIPGLNTDENAKPCEDRLVFAQ